MPEVGGNVKPGTGSAERSAGTPSDGEEGGGTVRDVTAILVGVLFVHTILAGFRVCCSPCHFSRVHSSGHFTLLNNHEGSRNAAPPRPAPSRRSTP